MRHVIPGVSSRHIRNTATSSLFSFVSVATRGQPKVQCSRILTRYMLASSSCVLCAHYLMAFLRNKLHIYCSYPGSSVISATKRALRSSDYSLNTPSAVSISSSNLGGRHRSQDHRHTCNLCDNNDHSNVSPAGRAALAFASCGRLTFFCIGGERDTPISTKSS